MKSKLLYPQIFHLSMRSSINEILGCSIFVKIIESEYGRGHNLCARFRKYDLGIFNHKIAAKNETSINLYSFN